MEREPILTKGFIVTLVTAAIGLALAFGLPLTDEQQQAILQLAGVLAPIIVWLGTWLWARMDTTPTADPKAKNEYGKVVDLVPADGSRLAGD